MGRCKRIGSAWVRGIGEYQLQQTLTVLFGQRREVANGGDGDSCPRAITPEEFRIVRRAHLEVFTFHVRFCLPDDSMFRGLRRLLSAAVGEG